MGTLSVSKLAYRLMLGPLYALWRPLACSALLPASLWALRACLPASLPPIAVLVVLLGAGGGIYAAAALALNQGSPSRALELFKVRS